MVGSFLIIAPVCVFMPRIGLMILGIVWALIRAYNITTLPIEIDASGRAKDVIYNARIVKVGKEFKQAGRDAPRCRIGEVFRISPILELALFVDCSVEKASQLNLIDRGCVGPQIRRIQGPNNPR